MLMKDAKSAARGVLVRTVAVRVNPARRHPAQHRTREVRAVNANALQAVELERFAHRLEQPVRPKLTPRDHERADAAVSLILAVIALAIAFGYLMGATS